MKPILPNFEASLLGLCEYGPLPERRVLSHEEVARELLAGAALDYSNPMAIDHLRRQITKELQQAFDLGFRAAGGSVSSGERDA